MSSHEFRTRSAVLAVAVFLLSLVGSAAPANAVEPFEEMPLWRVQVRITTGDTPAAGTDGRPSFRFNATAGGVRTLNPPTSSSFDRGNVDTHDVALLDTPSGITMFQVGVSGGDDWCVERVELLLNERVAFEEFTAPDGSCTTIGAGRQLEFSGTDLRANPRWRSFGTPPFQPTGVRATTLREAVTSLAGSAMLASPGYVWDSTTPVSLVRRDSDTLGVSFRVRVPEVGVGAPLTARISFDLRLSVGSDGRLHATKVNAARGAMSDTVAQHLDVALSRMTTRTQPHHPLLFSIDGSANTTWWYDVSASA